MVIQNVAKCAKKQSVVIIVLTNMFWKKSFCDKKSYLGKKRASPEHFSALTSKTFHLMLFFYLGNFFLHTWTIFSHDLSRQLWQQNTIPYWFFFHLTIFPLYCYIVHCTHLKLQSCFSDIYDSALVISMNSSLRASSSSVAFLLRGLWGHKFVSLFPKYGPSFP